MWRFVFLLIALLLILDTYLYHRLARNQHLRRFQRALLKWVLYPTTLLLLAGLLVAFLINDPQMRTYDSLRLPLMLIFLSAPFGKGIAALCILIDDMRRFAYWLLQRALRASPSRMVQRLKRFLRYPLKDTPQKSLSTAPPLKVLSRSAFLSQTAWVMGAFPIFILGYGVWRGAHDYRLRRVELPLKTLPRAFDGVRLIQISDLHVGSFDKNAPVSAGVELIRAQKADMIFFTGDLVNHRSSEMKPYIELLRTIQAPMGVYSVLGNHDYGDYVCWPSRLARQKNLEAMYDLHQRALGWRLLRNQATRLTLKGETIAIVGVENWSRYTRFPRYGNLKKALAGTEDLSCRLLLSHDPSHWDAEARHAKPDVEATFSGHTHGFQFGMECGPWKWSPAQYLYKQWAGLYQTQGKKLYVNRGFGYIGYPGRVGIKPEITCFTLRSTNAA